MKTPDNNKRSGNHLVSAAINKIRQLLRASASPSFLATLSPWRGAGGEVGRAGVGWRALALCALAFSPSFGGGWGEVVAQVNLTLSAPRSQGGTVVAASSITLKPGFRFVASSGNNLSLKIDANASTPYASGTPSLSQGQNYILTRTYKTDDGAGYMDQIQYIDGLGRPVQTVQPGITPSGADLVTYQEYDGFGRKSNAWLPAAINGNGAFQPLSQIRANATSLNGGDGQPYSYPVYEPSPLNRVQEQFGPGQEWRTNSKSVKTDYLTNNADYPCILFEVGTAGLVNKGSYAVGQLYVTKTTDEGGSVSYEFKDKLGQVVLTRQVNKGANHDTYYVYDDLGNKRYVLPPIAVDSLSGGLGDDSGMMKRYAYVYKYDGRNHCIQKRIPGCDWMYYIYDKADRLVITQDGIQRPDFKWTVYKYDKLGRMLYSSVVTDVRRKVSFEQRLEDNLGWVVTEDFGVPAPYYPMDDTGYTRGFFWQPYYYPTRLLSVNYYDDYRFLDLLPAATKTALQYTAEAGYGTRYDNAKGLVTGGRQYQLDDSTKYTVTATYYDYRGRVVQAKSTNHLGGTESEYIAYDFTGHPTQKKHVHTSPQAGTVTELYTYTYDHAGRPTETRHSLNGGARQLLAKTSYDELGRVQNRKAGNASVVNTAYGYNVRSWTTGITGSKFKEELVYNYDGNIRRQTFGDNSSYSIRYDFLYDDLSRLTDATSMNTSGDFGSDDAYGCHYHYDKQGNATSIITNGTKWVQPSSGWAPYNIAYDNLTLAYNGNQLRKVSDAADVSTNSITEQFLDFANADVEYAYNANGAMTKDLNKGISKIEYNLLNLPQQVDILSPLAEARNNYSYSADGVKLRVVKRYNSNFNTSPVIGSAVNTSKLNVTQTTDYVDGKLFENNVLDRIFVDGGYIKGGVYYFYETDHLGDNRTVINQSGTVVERNDYYPYGMQMAHNQLTNSASGSDNKRKFSGKELDVMGGLNLYDFSARSHDPTLGGFTTVDPMAEKFYSISPYVYCKNNPILLFDPNGLYPQSILVYDPNIGLYGGYHFTQSAATLLSLVSGVSKFYIENAIVQERAPGQYRPFYSSDKGGGAITLGTSGYQASITYTQNFFADDPSAYDNHGYGQNIHAWLALSSHEVGHIPQIDEAGGLLSYVGGMIKEYAQSGHDDAPREKKADEGYKNFTQFNSFVDKTYGAGALTNLFNSNARESKKTSTIEKWYGAYQDAQNAQKKQATQSFMSNFQNLESGKYKWDGTNWVKQ